MNKKILFFVLFSTVFVFSCNQKLKKAREETITQVIGTWETKYGIGNYKYLKINFREDMTGTLNYLDSNENDILSCDFAWDIITEKCACIDRDYSSYLSINFEDSCDTLIKNTPLNVHYYIDYITSGRMQLLLYEQTDKDIFNSDIYNLIKVKVLYRER